MRPVLLLLLPALAPLAAAQTLNAVQPKAATLLEDPKQCIRFAEDVGEALKRLEAGTADVYSGHAGVALFYFALYRATRKQEWSEAGGKSLALAMGKGMETGPGLYTGVAGIGQVCIDAWSITGRKHYLDDARACASRLGGHAGTDLISGAAGTGIFLLNLHAATKEKRYLDRARRAGDYLTGTAVRKGGRACWPVAPGRSPTVYLGLSHGAAGIGSFLLHLHRATGERSYLTLAEEAARYVLLHAIEEGADGSLWERTVPPTKDDTIRVQWCHGAPGIGLFFSDMVRHAKHDAYARALLRCIATTNRLGRTARRSGCQCHGVAGNAELFVEARDLVGGGKLMASARDFGSALLRPEGSGFKVRVRGYGPSYMTGLAGIGHFFLRLADPEAHPLPMTVAREKK